MTQLSIQIKEKHYRCLFSKKSNRNAEILKIWQGSFLNIYIMNFKE